MRFIFLIKKSARHYVNLHSNMKITTLVQSEQYNTVKSGHLNLVLDHWVRDVVYLFLKCLKYSVGVLKLSKIIKNLF